MPRKEMSYYDADRRKRRGRRDKKRFSITDYAMFALSALIALAIVLSWTAQWVAPSSYGFLTALGLVMPILFVLNVICLLYWIIRWRKGVLLPLAVFVAGVWGMSLFFKPGFTQDHSASPRNRSPISVATYNVRGMMKEADHKKKLFISSMGDVAAAIDSLDASILCIQEFQSTPDYPRRRFDEKLSAYRHKSVKYIIGGADDLGWGLALYSKFPIVKSGHLYFPGTSNSIMWADIALGRDTIRVFNAHLQTTSITASDQEYIVNMEFVTDSTRTSKVKRMAGKMLNNYVIRASQADSLAGEIASSPYPVVVCGDFNDTPVSYAYRRISGQLKDSFREAGRGYGYTYRGFFNMLRIDYVLHSPQLECESYFSPDFDCSDHNSVMVKFSLPHH